MTMIADIIFIVFALLVVWIYAKRGAVRSLFGILSIVVAGVAAYLLGPTVGATLITPLLGGVENKVFEMLMSAAATAEGTVDLGALFDQLPAAFAGMEEVVRDSVGAAFASSEDTLREIAQTIATPVVEYISRTVGCILVFAVVSIVMLLLKRVICPLMKLPLLKQADGVVGAVLGVVAAFVYLWVLCLIAGVLVEFGLLSDMQAVTQALADSTIYRFFSALSPAESVHMAAMLT